jgi:hypothetical protein
MRKSRVELLVILLLLLSLVEGKPAVASTGAPNQSESYLAIVSQTSLFTGRVYVNALTNIWRQLDLTKLANAPLAKASYPDYSQPQVFKQAPGQFAVIYRGQDDHVHAITNVGSQFVHSDLTLFGGGALAATDPFGFVGSDGTPTIVYMSQDKHVHALTYDGRGWADTDLTIITQAPARATAPTGYVRSDGISTVIYSDAENSHIIELRLENGEWLYADLSEVAGAVGGVKPVGYIRSDGITAIVYTVPEPNPPGGREFNAHVYELRLEDTWYVADLTYLAQAPRATSAQVFPYVRHDGMTTVLYVGYGVGMRCAVHELRLDGQWTDANLSAITGAPPAQCPGTGAFGYVRGDGVTAIVYKERDNNNPGHRIIELTLRDTEGWTLHDMTANTLGQYSSEAPSAIYPGVSCTPTDGQIVIYWDVYFTGKCVSKGVGRYPNPSLIGLNNDSVSSIKVGANVKVTFCEHDDFAGNCETAVSDVPDMTVSTVGNDQVSSMRIHCDPDGNQVALYIDVDYGGQCVFKTVGDYLTPTAIGLPNDAISSVRIGSDVRLLLCRDDNLGGICDTIKQDDANLFDNAVGNDQVSSFRVLIPTSLPHDDEPLQNQVYLPVVTRQ